jgi:hypothetical protein
MEKRYSTFQEFYPYYLGEHSDPACRRLHFAGSLLVVVVLATVAVTRRWLLLLAVPLVGYGFAWIGHFFYERNRPATFSYPLYSLLGDWNMFWQMLAGRIRF